MGVSRLAMDSNRVVNARADTAGIQVSGQGAARSGANDVKVIDRGVVRPRGGQGNGQSGQGRVCLLYTSDAADE